MEHDKVFFKFINKNYNMTITIVNEDEDKLNSRL